MRLEFALWCWGTQLNQRLQIWGLAGCWWGNLPPRSWSIVFLKMPASRCMESSKEVTWAGGKGQRPSQTEDRRPCVLQFICQIGVHRRERRKKIQGRGRARRIRRRRQIRRFILNLPQTKIPLGLLATCATSQRWTEKWVAAHLMFDSTTNSKAANHWPRLQKRIAPYWSSAGQETGTRQELYKETR